MIQREIMRNLMRLFAQYSVVPLTGPWQSGKTTLCRAALPNLAYLNLEAPDLVEGGLGRCRPRWRAARRSRPEFLRP